MVVEGENGQFPLNSRMFVLPFENDEKGSNVCSWVFRLDLERVTSCGEKRETQKGTRKKEEKETRMKTSKRKIRLRNIRSKELRFTSLPAHEPQGDF